MGTTSKVGNVARQYLSVFALVFALAELHNEAG